MYNEPLVQPCPEALDVPYLDFSAGKDLSWHAVQAFSCYQGTKVAQLVLAKPRAELRSAYQFHLVSHAGYYLPFMVFLNSSHWHSRFLSKSYIIIMYYLKLWFLLSSAFSRQNKTYFNCYQVFTGYPPSFPSLSWLFFVCLM